MAQTYTEIVNEAVSKVTSSLGLPPDKQEELQKIAKAIVPPASRIAAFSRSKRDCR